VALDRARADHDPVAPAAIRPVPRVPAMVAAAVALLRGPPGAAGLPTADPEAAAASPHARPAAGSVIDAQAEARVVRSHPSVKVVAATVVAPLGKAAARDRAAIVRAVPAAPSAARTTREADAVASAQTGTIASDGDADGGCAPRPTSARTASPAARRSC
jgi:hypothetical protein